MLKRAVISIVSLISMTFCCLTAQRSAIVAASLFVFSLFASADGFAQSNATSSLGTNVAGVAYWTSEQPFLNIFKTAGGWSTITLGSNSDTNEEVALYQHFLDSNGYPTTLTPGGSYQFNALSVLVLRLSSPYYSSPYYLAGDYLLQWNGSANFSYGFDPGSGMCTSSPCKITVTSPSGQGIFLKMQCTGTGCPGGSAYATNISLIYCGTYNSSAPAGQQCSATNSAGVTYDTLLSQCNSGTLTSCFNPAFLNLIQPFKTLRFIDWMNTAGNFQTNWTDRPQVGWVFWDDSRTNATINGADPRSFSDGVPAEVMFALCNVLNADCWFNMPPLATDDYVTQFATLAHSMLNSNLKVYVEYANELWNSVFAQQQPGNTGAPLDLASVWTQLETLGENTYPGLAGNPWGAAFQYGIMRMVQVGHDWKSAWGSDAARVIRLAGGQNGYTYRNQWILTSLPNGSSVGGGSQGGPTYWYGTTGGTVGQNVDAFAVAPYFGYGVPDAWTGFADKGLTALFTEINSGGLIADTVGCTTGGTIAASTCSGVISSPANGATIAFTLPDNNNTTILSGSYNSGTGVVSLALYSPIPGLAPGTIMQVSSASGTGSFSSINGTWTAGSGTSSSTLNFTIATGLTLTISNANVKTTISSGSYNSGTGVVSLTLSPSTPGLVSGTVVSVSNATGTGSFSSINGTWTAGSGTNSSTLNFTIATGLTLTISSANFEFSTAPGVTLGPSGGTAYPIQVNDGACAGTSIPSGTLGPGGTYTAAFTSAVDTGSCSGGGSITPGWRMFQYGVQDYTTGSVDTGMIAQTLNWATVNLATAQSYGLPLVAYEGGQTFQSGSDTVLQTLFAAVNVDARMGTSYTSYLNAWKALGGTMLNHYTDIASYSQYSYWGALQSVLQTSSPKYDALVGFIASNPCWWNDLNGCTASSPPGGSWAGFMAHH
jgi:hypothetical protein